MLCALHEEQSAPTRDVFVVRSESMQTACAPRNVPESRGVASTASSTEALVFRAASQLRGRLGPSRRVWRSCSLARRRTDTSAHIAAPLSAPVRLWPRVDQTLEGVRPSPQRFPDFCCKTSPRQGAFGAASCSTAVTAWGEEVRSLLVGARPDEHPAHTHQARRNRAQGCSYACTLWRFCAAHSLRVSAGARRRGCRLLANTAVASSPQPAQPRHILR